MSWQAETPQQKIDRLRAKLDGLQKSYIRAEAELAEMEASMRDFETEFNLQVGFLLEELALVEAELEAYKSRIRQTRMDQSIGEGYQSVEDQYEAKWNAPRNKRPRAKIEPMAETAPITQTRLKKLYRELARKYHPDLALNDEDRARRTAKMAAINEAYKAGSLVELQALADEAVPAEPASVIETPAAQAATKGPGSEVDQVQVLRDEIDRMQRQLYRVEDAIRNFHHRPLVDLALEAKLAQRDGRDLLAELAEELKRKIARKEAERDMIRSQFDRF